VRVKAVAPGTVATDMLERVALMEKATANLKATNIERPAPSNWRYST